MTDQLKKPRSVVFSLRPEKHGVLGCPAHPLLFIVFEFALESIDQACGNNVTAATLTLRQGTARAHQFLTLLPRPEGHAVSLEYSN